MIFYINEIFSEVGIDHEKGKIKYTPDVKDYPNYPFQILGNNLSIQK